MITAAPDLYAALKAYDSYFGDCEGEVHYNCTCDNCKTARAIIANGQAALAKAVKA